MAKKILYYLNQFFGQIGGEDQAHIGPEFKKEAVGPAAAFENMLDSLLSFIEIIASSAQAKRAFKEMSTN
jgi:hypothetical protein